LEPRIDDGTGYAVRSRDLAFLGLTDDDVQRWQAKATPLGMSTIQYGRFKAALRRAVEADGLPADTDVRLKGSAAAFFSGHHKPMPNTREALARVFRDVRKRRPEHGEVDAIEARLREEWITDNCFPSRRPFDSMFRLAIDLEQSDYDLQISSDEAVERCRRYSVEELEPAEPEIKHPKYDFVIKELVEQVFTKLYVFTLRFYAELGRNVTIAVFPSSGPPTKPGPLSAHFRTDDWCLPVVDLPSSQPSR
jgi:hypothetical protein